MFGDGRSVVIVGYVVLFVPHPIYEPAPTQMFSPSSSTLPHPFPFTPRRMDMNASRVSRCENGLWSFFHPAKELQQQQMNGGLRKGETWAEVVRSKKLFSAFPPGQNEHFSKLVNSGR